MKKLSRRIMLKGLGGAMVAAPFLQSVFARSAKADVGPPRRTILMYTHGGCITNLWFPAKLDGALTADDLLPTSLAPLAPFAKKLLIPRGIRSMNEWTQNNTGAGHGRGQGNDIHTQVLGSALTCQPVTPNSDDPFSFTDAKFHAMPIGPSLDHVMAQQLSASGTPLLMNTAGQIKEGPQTAISYSGPTTLFDGLSLVEAYASLTGLFDPNGPVNADSWAIAKGKALTDIVKDDLDSLKRKDMSQADKQKLEQWMQLSNDVTTMLASSQCSKATADMLGASGTVATGEGDAVTRKVNDSMDNADLYSALAVLTAACNANPVIVLKYSASYNFSGLGINVNSDNLSHRLDNASLQGTCMANVIDLLLKLDAYYAQKFANLVRMLDQVSDGDRTLLDNTIAFWMNESSDGCAHNLNNMPIIQAGSGGGYFKTGKIIHLDPTSGATAEQMLGNSLVQCGDGQSQMVDGLSQATGTDPRFGNAPVNKYFCNIMNAMGLRADETGYPAADGPSGEVTHFGYSDLTEDFCGGAGAVASAAIHNPGGFSELKAS